VRLYEATLYERPKYGDPMPVMLEGLPLSKEITAETAGKARYQFYLDLSDAWGDQVRFQDIRVRSLARETRIPIALGWRERLALVNSIIRVIGSHGRHFLSENSDRRELVENPFFAHFQVDDRNEVWFIDRYTRKPILVRLFDWPGFSDGGTLRDLVKHFAEHIVTNKPLNIRYFGPAPKWVCDGDPWGYGDSMHVVREEIGKLLKIQEAA
jgi:hypothetical protein